MDNLGLCRFHRGWAEEMLPEVFEALFGAKNELLENVAVTASRINSRNAAVLWESERNADFIATFLRRRREVEDDRDPELLTWIEAFERDKEEAALNYWFEVQKGIHESLREF